MNKKKLIFIPLALFGAFCFFVFRGESSKKKQVSIFGNPELNQTPRQKKEYLSTYEKIRGGVKDKKIRRKAVIANSPFFNINKQQAPAVSVNKKKPTPAPKKITAKKPVEEDEFYKVVIKKEKKNYYKALIREEQEVIAGKALKIVLQEDIKEKKLDAGTILKGIPSFEGGRIQIKVTAAIEGEEVRRVNLEAIDPNDLQEGLFHDEVYKQMEEETKESLLDEAEELGIRGARLARKAANLTRFNKKIIIEKGREVFLVLPAKKEKSE